MKLKFTTAGESHGKALVAIIEGLPAGLEIIQEEINHELSRRQMGYGRGGRMKIERDEIEIISGVRHGKTIGSPVAILIANRDFVHWEEVMSVDALKEPLKNGKEVKRPRPGHADLAGGQKFGTRDLRDILERASARETAARVASGAFVKLLLKEFKIEIRSHVSKLGSVPAEPLEADWEAISSISKESLLNCCDLDLEREMIALIDEAREIGDTLGGVFEVVVKGLPTGLGSHTSWNEKLDGRLAQAIMSIPAVKAVEIGIGVSASGDFGSQVHDEIVYDGTGIKRTTNRAGGLEGGITNGELLRIRGYKKPISTLKKRLKSIDIDTKKEDLAAFERSDITAVPAAGVIGEAMVALIIGNAMCEKFGGDCVSEMKENFSNYCKRIRNY